MSEIRKNLGGVTAYAYARSKGYTGTEEEFAQLMANYATVGETATEAAEQAISSAEASGVNSLKSEGYSVGKQNGEDVEEGSPYYHNNAKYYAEEAKDSETNAGNSESAASGSASDAKANALKSEGFAVGKKDGAAVTSESPYYHNNAKYYSEQSAASAATSAAMTGLAPAFSASKAYATGDYVLYNGTLYRFTEAHAAGAWTGSDATAVTLGPDVAGLKNALADPQMLVDAKLTSELLNFLEVENGKYVDRNTGEIKPNNLYSISGYIPVIPNAHYRGINISNYAWYDATKTFISGGNTLNDIVSPNNAEFLRVDFTTSSIDNAHVYYGVLRQNAFSSSLQFKVYYPWLVHPIIDQSMITDAVFLNLYDKNNTADGYYLIETTGDVGVASSYSVSNYIRIKPSTSYTANRALRYAFYDASRNYISGANVSVQPSTFTSPDNAQYIALSINKYQKDVFVLCESEYFNDSNVEHYQVVLPWLRATKLSRFDGNTLVCFGDSITHMGYTDEINRTAGINAINVGLSSGRYAYTSNSVKDKFSFYRIAYAISTGDWTIPNSLQGETGYESVYANIQRMQTIDFTKVQFASIAYGTNDFSSGTELDNPDNPLDTSTFKGAIRYSLKLITEKYPSIKIIGVTPCYRFWSENGVIIDDCDTHELYGHKLIDYVNAVKEVYTEYHLPVLDNLNNAGINQFNRLTYFGVNDGLHPNQTGRNLIANRICDSLLANY